MDSTKRYRYFVSYTYKFGKNYIFGNNEIHTKAPIMSLTHIKMIEQFFMEQGAKHLTIMHFVFLGEIDKPPVNEDVTIENELIEENLTSPE